MTEEEWISGTNVSIDGALGRLLHCTPTDSRVQNYSSQVCKHNTKLLLCIFNFQYWFNIQDTIFFNTRSWFSWILLNEQVVWQNGHSQLMFPPMDSHSISPLDKNRKGFRWEISLFNNNRKSPWIQKGNYSLTVTLSEWILFFPESLCLSALYLT